MRIEIGAGGISTCSSVNDYQFNMYSFADRVDDVLSCFKMIKAETENLNGGVGNLHEAVNEVSGVIDENSQRQADVKSVRSKTNSFLDLAIRVDQQVAVKVMQNREQFYRVYEWLRPNPTEEEKSFLGQMWDWLCGVGEAVVEGIKEGWNWITDTAKKIWDGLVAFYEENKKIIDTILIAAGAVLAVAAVVGTGGLALAPLLAGMGLSTAAAVGISIAVATAAVVTTVLSAGMNIADTWCEIDNPLFNAAQGTLNVFAFIFIGAYSIGSIYNSINHISPEHIQQMGRDAKFMRNGDYSNGLTDYGELDSLGRSTSARAMINEDMIGTGTPASQSIRPAGFEGGRAGHARGHLIGNQLGGDGRDVRNLMTIFQNPTNNPDMLKLENTIRGVVESGEKVKYLVTPLYNGTELVPHAIRIEAVGNNGFKMVETIINAAR